MADIVPSLSPDGDPRRSFLTWLLPLGVLCVAYGLLGLTLAQPLSHLEIMQRCVLVDPARARLWSVGNVEIGMAYLGVFGGMLYYFLRTYSDDRAHLRDLGLALTYLFGSFALDYVCVQTLQPFTALLIGDAVVITFTALVSRQLWFQRLLGVFVPLVFLTCGIGHFLEGLSYWKLTYPVNVPWTMVTADIGFAILLNASRFPAFLRGEDVVEALAAERTRAEALEIQAGVLRANAEMLQEQITKRLAADEERERAEREQLTAERERSEADEARRVTEGLYRALFETMNQGVIYQDVSGMITDANPAAERLLGLTLDQMRGLTSADPRWRAVREDGTEKPSDEHPISVAMRTGQPVRDVVMGVYHPPTEETRWLRVSATPEFHEGDFRPFRVYAMFEDITERRAARIALEENEQRLRLALESGRLGDWEMDLTTGEFRRVSAAFKALYGLGPEAPFAVADRFRAVHPADLPRVKGVIEEAMRTGRMAAAEFRVRWPDGSEHWLRGHGQVVYGSGETPTRLIGASQDITEQKGHEAEREARLTEAVDRADHDALTGLWNHPSFHRRLDHEAERSWRDNSTLAVVLLDLDNFKFFNDAYGYAVGNEVLLQVAARLLAVSRPYDTVARFGGDEFALILPGIVAASAETVEARLNRDLRGLTYLPPGQEAAIPIELSVGTALISPYGPNTETEPQAIKQKALRDAEERLQRAKTGADSEAEAEKLRRSLNESVSGFSMLDALLAAVDNKDRYTRRHSEDVLTYSTMIARQMGLDKKAQHTISVAALLHDVGKIGVPDRILRKPGRLEEEEFEAVKQHPQIGAIIVQAVSGLEETLDAVRHHHEQWDGGGYPFGLEGEQIPLIARLMAVADAFSAMTTDRAYRKGRSYAEALSALVAGSGSQWAPDCVEAFRQAMAEEGHHPIRLRAVPVDERSHG